MSCSIFITFLARALSEGKHMEGKQTLVNSTEIQKKDEKTKRQKDRMTSRHFPRKSIACLKERFGRKTNNGEFVTFYCQIYLMTQSSGMADLH